MNRFRQIAACLTLALLSFASYADPIHTLDDQAPVGFNTNNNFYQNARGWEFTAGTNNLYVSQLGIAAFTSGSFTLSLWDVATASVLAQTTIKGATGGQWNWASLGSSVALTSGAHYLVMGIGNDADAAYYFGYDLASSWYPAGDINYLTTKFCNNCTANTFPTNSLDRFQYGLVDIGYTVGRDSEVPEPAPLALLAIGLLASSAVSRKKSL
ncbi:PEP-CTERM sorting domain-containing protein [Massilia sp. S19_KUP03_FR1]|uniref:PEP-CTERM sorting domain-containing protein n=1 Tax=Massilia sp. S19_KUP03_FR1 TaxID=3025503 RepID=UPI002FCDB544